MRLGIQTITLLFVALVTGSAAHAQADSVASRPLQIHVFAGPTLIYVGNGAHNASLTAGFNIGFGAFHGFLPTLEARGTIPVDDGTIAWEKVGLGGIRVEKPYGRVHPYLDLLVGRGEVLCAPTTCPNTNGLYDEQKTPSNVFSPGAGVDLDVTPILSVKLDLQLQQYNVKFTESGSLYSKAITIGVVYHIGFGEHHPK